MLSVAPTMEHRIDFGANVPPCSCRSFIRTARRVCLHSSSGGPPRSDARRPLSAPPLFHLDLLSIPACLPPSLSAPPLPVTVCPVLPAATGSAAIRQGTSASREQSGALCERLLNSCTRQFVQRGNECQFMAPRRRSAATVWSCCFCHANVSRFI